MIYLLRPQTFIGLAIGVSMALLWAFTVHGPKQYNHGGANKAAELQRKTDESQKAIKKTADQSRLDMFECVSVGRVWSHTRGRCL